MVSIETSAGSGGVTEDNAARSGEITARLERVPVGPTHRFAQFICASVNFFDAFDAMAISFVLPVLIPLWNIQPTQTGFLISANFIGAALGLIIFGAISERWGRRFSMMLSLGIFSLMSILEAFAPNFTVMTILRLIGGCALGGEVPVGFVYLNEIAKAQNRGRFGTLYAMLYGIGVAASSFVAAWAVPTLGWQSMFIIGAFPAVFIFAMRLRLPESARWLVARGRYKEADDIVTKMELEGTNGDLSKLPPLEILPVVPLQPCRWQEVFQGIYLKRTMVFWVMGFCIYLCNFSLTAWAPSIYTTVLKVPVATSLRYAAISQIFGILGSVSIIFIIDRWGRKKTSIIALASLATILLTLFAIDTKSAGLVCAFISVAYFFVTWLSAFFAIWIGESLPNRMRSIGTSIQLLPVRFASIIGAPIVGMIIAAAHLNYVFLMFGAFAFIGFLTAVFFSWETTGKTLEELAP
jgi:MFS transporter, putative metabolite:H+ symporter